MTAQHCRTLGRRSVTEVHNWCNCDLHIWMTQYAGAAQCQARCLLCTAMPHTAALKIWECHKYMLHLCCTARRPCDSRAAVGAQAVIQVLYPCGEIGPDQSE